MSESDSPLPGIRINKYFTEHGFTSRREADKLVADGRVQIDGRVAKPGDRVLDGQTVSVDGEALRPPTKKPVVIAYHKPPGIICTTDPNVEDNIVDAVGYPERIFNIGRLDRFSEGLILLTNRGEVVNGVLRARYGHEKEYLVELNGPITDAQIRQLANGVPVLGRDTLPCAVERMGSRRIRMVITEGRNRQIRRMVEFLGLRVSRLTRVRIMHIELGQLPKGRWRYLSDAESKELESRLNANAQADAANVDWERLDESFPDEEE